MEKALSALNGPLLLQRPTGKPAGSRNEGVMRWARLSAQLPSVRRSTGLMLLAVLVLCSACATPSPPAEWPKNPPPPVLAEPTPSQSYSSKAFSLIETWRKRLIDF